MTTAIRLECSYCYRRYLLDHEPSGPTVACRRCGHPIALDGSSIDAGNDANAATAGGKARRRLQTRAARPKSDRQEPVGVGVDDDGVGGELVIAPRPSAVISDVTIDSLALSAKSTADAGVPDAVPLLDEPTDKPTPRRDGAFPMPTIPAKIRTESESGAKSDSGRQHAHHTAAAATGGMSLADMVGSSTTSGPTAVTAGLGLSVPPMVRRLVNQWKDGQIEAGELFASISDKNVARQVLGEIKKLAPDKAVDWEAIERELGVDSTADAPLPTPMIPPEVFKPSAPMSSAGLVPLSAEVASAGADAVPVPADEATIEALTESGAASSTTTTDGEFAVELPTVTDSAFAGQFDEFDAAIGDMEPAAFGALDPAFAEDTEAVDVSLTRRFEWEDSVEVRRDEGAWDDDSGEFSVDAGAVSDVNWQAVQSASGGALRASAGGLDAFGGLTEARFDHLEATPLVPLADDVFGAPPSADFASDTRRFSATELTATAPGMDDDTVSRPREEPTEIDIFFDPGRDDEPIPVTVDPDQILAQELVASAALFGGADAEFNPFLGDFSESGRRTAVPPDIAHAAAAAAAAAVATASTPAATAVSSSALVAGRSGRLLPAERVKATAPAAKLRRKAPLPPGKRMHLAGVSLGAAAEIEPPPDLRLDIDPATPLISEPAPGTVLSIGDATYTVMSADDALVRLLRSGELPEGTYVHSLDLGYFPDSWDNPTSWHLRSPLASRMYAREEDFYIPRGGPTASDCLPVAWPRRPIKIHRCCFGTVNLSRASFPAGFALTESRIMSRATAVRSRFDGWVDFSRTVFPHLCAFFQSRATGPVTFRRCYFMGVAHFAELRFDGFTSFRQADIAGDLDLSGARFTDDLDLREVVIMGNAMGGQLQVHGNADFSEAGIHGDFDLQLATVRGAARFGGLACGSYFQAERTRLLGLADFTNARFAGPAHFAHSRFGADAVFSKVRFGSVADLYHIEVDGALDLTEAIFHGDAVFATSRFQGLVRFNVDPISRIRTEQTQRSADFRGSLRFDHAVFQKPLLANGVRFRQRTTFRRCTFEESATFAEAFFETGFDLSEAFVGKELDFRSATVGGRLNLNSIHVGGRAMLFGARFRAISLHEATVGVLALDKQQLYPDSFDLRENRHDSEVPPFRPYETRYPVKLYHYRHATMGSDPALPGSKPQKLSRDKHLAAKRARLIGGMDAELKLEEGGARLVAFDRAREEFILLEKSFRELGRQSPADWAFLMGRRMARSARVIGGRGIKPVDEALLIVEREITYLDELRRMIDAEDVLNPKFPAELRARRESLLGGKGGPRESWARLKELSLQAIRGRLTPLEEKRRRILDRLKPLERPRPRSEWERYSIPTAWHTRTLFETALDVSSGYGTQPWRLVVVALLVIFGFALFYTRYSYYDDLRLHADAANPAAMRAIVFDNRTTPAAPPTAPLSHLHPAAHSPHSADASISPLSLAPAHPAGWMPTAAAAVAVPSADPLAGKTALERFGDFTLYSVQAFTGQGFSDTRPRRGHWMVYVVMLETILGLITMIFFIITIVRKALR